MFYEFFKIGLFAVGGGPATIPFLQDLARSDYGWFNPEELGVMIAIAESTPGPIGVNMATYVGYQTGADLGTFGGFIGALVAPLGLTVPALIVIVIISKVLQKFRSSKYVEWVFYGLRAASLGLIASACLGVAKIAFFSAEAFAEGGNFFMAVDYKSIILSVLVFVGITKFKKVHPIVFILIAAIIGIPPPIVKAPIFANTRNICHNDAMILPFFHVFRRKIKKNIKKKCENIWRIKIFAYLCSPFEKQR